MEKPNYQLYRNTTLGQALQKTLDDFISEQLIPESLSKKVMDSFDKSINRILPMKAKNKVNFRADKLRAYRYCDNVWTFIVEQVDLRDAVEGGTVARLKIVACDGQSTKGQLQGHS
ncbi:hypothetical protein CAEBREN_10283 [Caenorhabditis brenneri]|uniref:Transcription initiation factor IIA subunit 2 n=1 Tax=Caenorhabditis brenneri TaxID=135651 RepID=G0NI56_CAEBE|nr:hypothetical protein CAEBREN_20155 [Caenorhabditis brenneri]EGT53532.1 hypothetical protein CAEBREN_10283 [Caenorhabditis brenneri]